MLLSKLGDKRLCLLGSLLAVSGSLPRSLCWKPVVPCERPHGAVHTARNRNGRTEPLHPTAPKELNSAPPK